MKDKHTHIQIGRRHGRQIAAFAEFALACDEGKGALWVGVDFVAMPRKDYDEINNTIKALKASHRELVEALERLARLGNEPNYGNSDGNIIAQKALAKAKSLTDKGQLK